MGNRKDVASTGTTTTECVAATASMRPVPRWLPHVMPSRLQPFVPHQLVYSSLAASCTHPHAPHLSHDYRPNRHVSAHTPSPAPIAAHPMRPRLSPQRFKIARPSLRSTPCAQSPLLLFAGTPSQLHTACPRSRPGGTQRHPFLRNTIFWGCLPNYDSQPQLRNPNIIIRRSVCGNLPVRVSSLKLRPTSAADAVVQTTTASNQPPCRERRLSTPLPLRTISLNSDRLPPILQLSKRPHSRPPTLLPHFPTRPKPQHPPPVNPRHKNAARTLRNQPPKTPRKRRTHAPASSPTARVKTTVLLRLPPTSPFVSVYHLHHRYRPQ